MVVGLSTSIGIRVAAVLEEGTAIGSGFLLVLRYGSISEDMRTTDCKPGTIGTYR